MPASPAPALPDWQEYQGKSFTLNYPQGWQVFGGDDGGDVTFAPKDGVVTQGGNTQIGFGAIAGMLRAAEGPHGSAPGDRRPGAQAERRESARCR